jgi:hypothetical protein
MLPNPKSTQPISWQWQTLPCPHWGGMMYYPT